MTDGALAGLRVIDAATLAAGPLIATWMGEHGAEVIKVEQPDGGDPLRQWGAQRDGIGLMWKSVARNKKCVTLNLRLEAGRDLLRSLARQADVLIMNLRPSTMRKWGLDVREPRRRQPEAGHGARHRVRRGRPEVRLARVRHPGRGDERLRAPHREPRTARRPCRRSCSRTAWPR